MTTNRVDMLRNSAMRAAAELLESQATECAARMGMNPEAGPITVLEYALGLAYAKAALFRGANDTPERLQETIKVMTRRIGDEVTLQFHELKGGKYLERPGHG